MFKIIFLGKKIVESFGGFYVDDFIGEFGVEKIQVLVLGFSTYFDHLYNKHISLYVGVLRRFFKVENMMKALKFWDHIM